MGNIIELLPDHVANQIAAGEVIQRPASVVKELLENAVDSGASSISIHIKDSGKTLIQISDNGCGMTEIDARMSLERHATSKIKKAEDLFAIKTFGFRGEAMASIAAVSHMDIKTRPQEEQVGTHLVVEGSKITKQEPCSTPGGTTTCVKNLFYNIPARRKFLKSDNVEFRHILDEFQRVALTNEQISFEFYHNNHELFHLPASGFRQRIVGIFGKSMNNRLVPVEEETSIVNVTGFIGKPEAAKKTRGEQFIFVNNRFIKSNYFHHAIGQSYEKLISDGYHPSYFLKFDVDPQVVDVNIHPTKTEVKFEQEKDIYVILKTTVKKSLGQYNIVPSLDFTSDVTFDPPPKNRDEVNTPGVFVDPDFNPFKESNNFSNKSSSNEWESVFPKREDINQFSFEEDLSSPKEATLGSHLNIDDEEKEVAATGGKVFFQLHRKFILSQLKSGLMVIHQQRAHECILYERFLKVLEEKKGYSQQQLFPVTVEFSTYDANLVVDLEEDLKLLGFEINSLGKNTFSINGLPSDVEHADGKGLLENTLEQYKINRDKVTLDKRKNLAVSLARNTSVKVGRILNNEEMQLLIDELFACEMPYATPSGKPIINMIELDELDKKFE